MLKPRYRSSKLEAMIPRGMHVQISTLADALGCDVDSLVIEGIGDLLVRLDPTGVHRIRHAKLEAGMEAIASITRTLQTPHRRRTTKSNTLVEEKDDEQSIPFYIT
ncbi:hypothetical protein [Acidisphaera sp. L21]|uniref:hypothetical protein n=1 Tax=Acidisphaera sp. L21 TaxID=1641851 RepID=UPI00131B6F8C|nr:hypothetical protein [Acidisphaera sp. L21]